MQEHQAAPWLPLPVPKPVTADGQAALASQEATAFVVVLRCPSRGSPKTWAEVIISYARYHRMLGFAAALVYIRDDMLLQFVSTEAVQQAIAQGIILLMRWNDIEPFPDDDLQVYDQVRSP